MLRLKKSRSNDSKSSAWQIRSKRLSHSFNLDNFYNDNTPQGIERLENLRELASVAEAQGAEDLGTFLEDVALVSDLDNMSSDGDTVTLMTIHGSKGLEFPVVFIAGLEEGIFPHSRSAPKPRGARRRTPAGLRRYDARQRGLVSSYMRPEG
jgi:DNA helicase-2/ATP-dependent DNA helicase PcrA